MHRATPANSSFRGYVAGGARTTIPQVDDSKMMQETQGNFMANEKRSAIEAPQNYGFTSVVRKAVKDAQGNITSSAEGFVSFMGGNRSFPVMGIMDDRRYRPMSLKEGENGQYDDLGQMTLIRRTGLYLLSLDSPDDSQSSSSSAPQTAASSGSSGSGQVVKRMASLRHVNKQPQQRPQQSSSQGGSSGSSSGTQSTQSEYKHEGDSVNTEVRTDATTIKVLDGENVVAVYDKSAGTWTFTCSGLMTLNSGKEIDVVAPLVKLGDKNAKVFVKLCDDSCATKVMAV
jgi:phage gp45-like